MSRPRVPTTRAKVVVPTSHETSPSSSRRSEKSDRASGAPGPEATVPPPQGLEVVSLTWEGEKRLVLSFPLCEPRWPETLTRAERTVAEMLLDGATNAEIARRRGTSARTVTNQVASIFRKARVVSRVELAAEVFGQPKGT